MSKRIPSEEILTSKYFRLKPIKELEPYTWTSKSGKKRSKRLFLCECDCGSTLEVSLDHLRSGHTKSCGCHAKDMQIAANTTHGEYVGATNTHPLHTVWRAMKNRVLNDKRYQKLEHSVQFLENPKYFYEYVEKELGDKPDGYSLDREDVHRGYLEGNIRWASDNTQAQNQTARGGSSVYKGASFIKSSGKWQSNITKDGVKYYLGLYSTEIGAARAYVCKWLALERKPETEENIRKYLDYFKQV